MTVETQAAQAVCMGCCLNPGFINPYAPYINPNPFTHDPSIYNPPQPNPFQQQTFQTSSLPFYIDNLALARLSPEETDLLKRLGECYNLFIALDRRSEADNKEFVDAIHRLQQLIALRVARRVNPEVWAQPA